MSESNSKVALSQLSALEHFVSEYSALGHDYVLSRINSSSRLKGVNRDPVRIDGMTWILCMSGTMDFDMNLNHCRLTPNTLAVCGPNSLMQLRDIDWSSIDAYMLFVSSEFIGNSNLDPNVMASVPVAISPSQVPVMEVSEADSEMLRSYFDLIHRNTLGNPDDLYVRSISRCLISALCYQVIQYATRRVKIDEATRPRTRRHSYVHDFMKLLHTHHHRERSVAFYAGKLFISPKYLSLIIKEMTGRSAAAWIDELVILEAKNMLRFSGKNIQQVAYELNFPNQSSFGKYFKHLTGMSPSEYQRS
ncbi:MAG: helix-turn-helix transcriptional regulator [Bacteroidales bacterium]|nr:helix-turn-helix transcriptional regulator [Bacteroidales bacterium]MBD5377895.1 helix-turn-helix transcriptional regulator [Bacteroides sp.]